MEYCITNKPSAEAVINVTRGELEMKVIKNEMPPELPKVVVDGRYAYELLKGDLRVERYLNL